MSSEAAQRFQRLLDRVAASIRFEIYAVGGAPVAWRSIRKGTLLATNVPDDFRTRYIENREYERDPLIVVLRAASRPVRTADIRAAAEAEPALMPNFVAIGEALGTAVVAVPLRFRGRLGGGVIFRRREPEFTDAEVEYLELVAPALHLAALDLPAAAPTNDLTARERECLAWTSVGKTAWEIGSILGISEHTAVAHLNAAVRKLGAASRAHAVAEALRRGLIE
ncbi:hypothetical protein BLTE_28190 [Blastochloris tepida]|uniref:HTH luxR-type domain-containing protein n=2 Tax=Blastochloris tepida TaxID=2233851 RepID=A0A348G3K1_9HYPH|nr:hypothetical protein BLTE_28190 [Blastochloris tepida]